VVVATEHLGGREVAVQAAVLTAKRTAIEGHQTPDALEAVAVDQVTAPWARR
jgi:hypothetical protein